MTDVATLTREESIALADCEQRIERGMKTFIEVGQALAAVRENRLYRADYDTFESYCQGRWGFTRQRAQQITAAADLVTTIVDAGLPAPTNEGQARELGKVPEPERAEVWKKTVERTEGKPTAAAVRESAEELRKRADEQRDAREHLRQIVELGWSPNWKEGHVEQWAKQLGPYDDELSDLTSRALKVITVLDGRVEAAGVDE